MTLSDLKPLLSRKFILAVFCVLLGFLLKDVSGADKLDFFKWMLGIFVTANVGEKAVTKSPDAV